MNEEKPAVKSKLNWTGFMLVIVGAVSLPEFHVYFGDLIPQALLSKITFASGILVIAFRTLGTDVPVSLPWRKPFESE